MPCDTRLCTHLVGANLPIDYRWSVGDSRTDAINALETDWLAGRQMGYRGWSLRLAGR